MKLPNASLFLLPLIAGLSTPFVDAAATIARVSQIRILTTINSGGSETWDVVGGSFVVNGLTYSAAALALQNSDGGGPCSPSSPMSATDGFHWCDFYYYGSRETLEFCLEDGTANGVNTNDFQSLQIGVAGEGSNNPVWDFTFTERSIASYLGTDGSTSGRRFFTRGGSTSSRRGRIFMTYETFAGTCDEYDFLVGDAPSVAPSAAPTPNLNFLSDPSEICGQTLNDPLGYEFSSTLSDIIDCGTLDGPVIGDGVTLNCNGKTMDGSKSSEKVGIIMAGAGAQVIDCKLENFSIGIAMNGDGSTLQNSMLTDSLLHGIVVSEGGSKLIQDVTVKGSVYYGIFIQSSSSSTTTVQGATVENNSQGIIVNRGATGSVTINSPIVRGNSFHGIFVKSKDAVVNIDGGTIENNGRHGVLATRYGASGMMSAENIEIQNNGGSGVVVSGAQNFEIEGCIVDSNGKDGIVVRGATVSVRCTHSTNNNQFGIYEDVLRTSTSSITISDMVVYGSQSGTDISVRSETDVSGIHDSAPYDGMNMNCAAYPLIVPS